jgi:hypothetical protein
MQINWKFIQTYAKPRKDDLLTYALPILILSGLKVRVKPMQLSALCIQRCSRKREHFHKAFYDGNT